MSGEKSVYLLQQSIAVLNSFKKKKKDMYGGPSPPMKKKIEIIKKQIKITRNEKSKTKIFYFNEK